MTESARPYLTACPLGCDAALTATGVRLPEGELRRCEACGQRLSQVTENAYWQSMRQFDRQEFNLAPAHELRRRFKIARRRLDTIGILLKLAPSAIRGLGGGGWRGKFLSSRTVLFF